MNGGALSGTPFPDYTNHQDSFMGPTLTLHPEELDRLDASQYDEFVEDNPKNHLTQPYYPHQRPLSSQPPFRSFSGVADGFNERSLYAKVDRSIQRSLDRWDAERETKPSQFIPGRNTVGDYHSTQSPTLSQIPPNLAPPYYSPQAYPSHGGVTPITTAAMATTTTNNGVNLPFDNAKILTPPSSGPAPLPDSLVKPSIKSSSAPLSQSQPLLSGSTVSDPIMQRMATERDTTLTQMQRTFDQRLEALCREETERRQRLELTHQEQMDKLNRDVDTMIVQHQQVLKLKTEVERGLQKELELARRDLTREKEQRQTDQTRHQRTVRELNRRITELENRLQQVRQLPRRRTRTISFDKDYDGDDDDESDANTNYNSNNYYHRNDERGTSIDRETYERRIQTLRRDYDGKIADLVKQFEREKAATLEILKSKVKAEVSLLLPRLCEQFQRAYKEKVNSLKINLTGHLRDQFEGRLRRLREEHAVERRVWQRQAREQIEKERTEITQKLKAKYEMKILDVQNECERRILERLRSRGVMKGSGLGSGRSHSKGNNNKFNDSLDDSLLAKDIDHSLNFSDSFSFIS